MSQVALTPQGDKRPYVLRKGVAGVADLNLTPLRLSSSTHTLNRVEHAGRLLLLDRAAGIAVTLPAATGTGDKFHFVVVTTITSNSTTIKVADNTDIMAGFAIQSQDGGATSQVFETASTDDTITFNGTTTGGIKGDIVELWDLDTNLWSVRLVGAATGTEATPFSATV